ncbi:hypothetical protein ASG05_05690 [Frigoribacterium sp. Leaf186]|nr:hypothetical protein ASG05_05690 [Frigoribacterium sp. Leaf186]
MGCVLSAVLGAVFVRTALDALDAQPHAGATTEHAYLVVAIVALAIWWGGTSACIVAGRLRLRRSTMIATLESTAKTDTRPPTST